MRWELEIQRPTKAQKDKITWGDEPKSEHNIHASVHRATGRYRTYLKGRAEGFQSSPRVSYQPGEGDRTKCVEQRTHDDLWAVEVKWD